MQRYSLFATLQNNYLNKMLKFLEGVSDWILEYIGTDLNRPENR